jgi:CBS domain-containing protein
MSKSTIGSLPVSVFSADTVLRVRPEANLWAVASALAAGDVGILVVADEEDIQGVVSERDVVKALAARCDPDATTAASLCVHDVVWCAIDADVADVAEEMMERYVRHVLLEADGALAGIVSARDLLGAYASVESDDDKVGAT